MNKIVEEKGEDFAQVLVDGINIGMVLGAVATVREAEARATRLGAEVRA